MTLSFEQIFKAWILAAIPPVITQSQLSQLVEKRSRGGDEGRAKLAFNVTPLCTAVSQTSFKTRLWTRLPHHLQQPKFRVLVESQKAVVSQTRGKSMMMLARCHCCSHKKLGSEARHIGRSPSSPGRSTPPLRTCIFQVIGLVSRPPVYVQTRAQEKFSKAAKRLALVRHLMPAFDPAKYPKGRISRAILQHSGSDWMSKV